jgi:C4-dicarboxylate-specific signal transduction histidine kinase
VRGSIRLHLFSALVLLPVIVAAVMTIVAIKLFRQDKELYVSDLSSQSVELVARNLATTLESLRLRAALSTVPLPPIVSLGPATGELPQLGDFRIENVSEGATARVRVIARIKDRGVAIDVPPEALLDLRGYEGPTELAVINDQGRVVVHRDARQVTERRTLTALVQRLQVFALSGSRLGTRVVDLEGVPTLVAYARTAGHVAVIQTIPRREVFAAADPLITSALLASAGVVVIAVLVALLLGRSISRPLRLMAAQVEAIGRGEFGVAMEHKTSGEVAQLLESLNATSASLKKRDQELMQVQQQLLQAERLNSASRMISSIVKELSAPLETCFNLANETMLLLPASGGELRALQQRILAEADRGANILQNLSRASTRDETGTRPVEIDMLVADVLMASGPVFERRQLTVESDLTQPVGRVVVSPDQLRNALTDVFLFVAEQAQPTAPVQVSIGRRDAAIAVCVRYGGAPISDAQRTRLLHPFQSDGGDDDAAKGSLVLAVAAMVVEEQGGRLTLEPQAAGNQVSVLLPSAEGRT